MKSIHRCASIVLAFFITAAMAHGQIPRIDPAGIPGSLLLGGGGDVSEAALARFIELAGGENAKIVFMVHSASEGEKKRLWPEMTRLNAIAKTKQARAP